MANWDMIEVECDNPEIMKLCAEIEEDVSWIAVGKSFATDSRWSYFVEKLKEVSKKFPEEVLKIQHSFQSSRFSEIFSVEILNGEYNVLDIKPSYQSENIPIKNLQDQKSIAAKTESFCRRLDLKKSEEAGPGIDWFQEEVCYKFEYDGEDGKKYKIEATKNMDQISYKVFEGLVKYDWQEIDDPDVLF